MSQLEEEEEEHVSYYAVLNVAREASQEEIKKAYRTLANVFHPDKHRDESIKDQAQQAFARLQEAYEVLSDPEKRQVYDIYGRQGLEAGLQVGSKLKSREELRAEWQDFQERLERKKQEALTNHKGYYLCKMDAEQWLRNPRHLRAPDFKIVVVQNSIDVPVSDNDIFHLQGQAALRGHQGSGTIVGGYRRIISADDSLDLTAVVGLRTLFSLTSTRQLSPYSSASLTSTWSAQDGVGLQLSTSRQLFSSSQGTLTWVVGPLSDSSMGLSISHRGKKYVLTAKLDVGAVTSVSGKLQWFYREDLHVRLQARCGTSGVDAEAGLFRRFSPYNSGYVGTVAGLHGITMKFRYTRMGQVFEFPVALSRDVREWQLLAAALVLPPLTSLVMSRCVVRPLLRWHRKRRDAKARAESRKALEQQLSKAAAERALLEPVARRKARAEANKQGLVVLEAVYGVLEEYFKQQGGSSIAAGSGDAAGSSSAAAAQQQQQQQQQAADASSQQQQEAADASSQQQQDKEHQGSKGAAQGQKEGQEKEKEQVEPEVALYIDVTHALQYLVSGSKLQLHAGVSKLGLMGFADVALGADKQLHVVYCHGRHVQQVTVEDEQRLVLPGPGQEVGQGPQLQALLQRGNARLGLALEARDGAVVQGPEDEAGLRKLVAEK